MPRTPSAHRRLLATTGAAALILGSAGLASAASTAEQPPSTPVPVVTVDGQIMSYAVNLKRNNYGQITKAQKQIIAAGGTVVQTWQQIGVIIAHSDRANFLTALGAGRPSSPIESAGPTRTAPVVEGTPGQSNTAVPPGKFKKNTEPAVPITPGADAPSASDPFEYLQWGNIAIKAPQAQDINPGSRSVVVGINDSGIEATHPDLAANVVPELSRNCTNAGQPQRTGWEPTTSFHGTHVAGIVAAAANGVGIVGVAPNVRLASFKVVNDEGFIFPEYAICGIVTATDLGVKVTNHSYYIDPWTFWCDDQPEQAPAKEAVRRAFAYADDKGGLAVAAAGNSNYDLANKTTDGSSPDDSTPVPRTINSGCQDIPTELDGVVTVSSTQSDGAKSSFSNYGDGVIDVAAPGSSIPSTVLNGKWGYASGTSMASPHVAGVAALLLSTHPGATDEQLQSLLRAEADDKPCPADARCTGTPAYNGFFGDGLVDALDAVSP